MPPVIYGSSKITKDDTTMLPADGSEDEEARACIDLHKMCLSNKRWEPLARYFQRGVSLADWDTVSHDIVGSLDACDRVLGLQFKTYILTRYPVRDVYTLWVRPVPHETLKPRSAFRVVPSQASDRVGYAFRSYDAAVKARNHLVGIGFAVTNI